MIASTYRTYGQPDEVIKIEELDKPRVKDKHILVKVMASTVNRTDCAMLLAKPFIMRFMTGLFKPRNPILGTEFAGEVIEVGKGVSKFKEGDKVFGFNDIGVGAHAEYMLVSENNSLDLMPDNYSYQNAAASIEGGHYAYNFINKVNLKPGEKVLVYGASGSIGSAMVQLLKHFEADITAVGNDKIQPTLEKWGVNKRYDFKKLNYRKLNDQFDYVFDAVGKINFFECKHLLKPGGVYISSELGPGGQNIYLPFITKVFSRKRVKFPFPSKVLRSIAFIKKLIVNGEYMPVIDRVFPLEETAAAFEYVASAQKTGTVVINIANKV